MKYGAGNKKVFSLEYQGKAWFCWASIVAAVAKYHKTTIIPHKTLPSVFKSELEEIADIAKKKFGGELNKPRSPKKVLKELCNFDCDKEINYTVKPANKKQIELRKKELSDFFKTYLDQTVLICGITEANDKKWELNTVPLKLYTFRHAILVYAYDDSTEKVRHFC